MQVTFTERTGYSLSQNFIGNIISVQEIFGAGQNVRLAELGYTQSLAGGRVETRVGWIHASDDFSTSPLYCYFQNNGLCGQIATVVNSGTPRGLFGRIGSITFHSKSLSSYRAMIHAPQEA